jgi:hypothetical protein
VSITGVSGNPPSSDGTDDFGLADGPQDLPENETFGVAFVARTQSQGRFFGVNNSGNEFSVAVDGAASAGSSDLVLRLLDGSSEILLSSGVVADGDIKLACINKLGNDASTDIRVFIDDMSSSSVVPITVDQNTGFDNNQYGAGIDMGFFARNTDFSGITQHLDAEIPFIEFNEQPYSQQDRLDLKQRVPGL